MSYAMRKLQEQIRRSSLLGGGGTKIPHSPFSSNLPASRNYGSHHGAGHPPSSRTPSLLPQPRTTNVILFGETGVGKSSVINLIARKDVAKVASGPDGCTMNSTPYEIYFDGMNFTVFDTIGLEEPEMGVNGYLRAIEKAFDLITTLEAAGGIHLLLFCMRAGRVTKTTRSNYRMFYECLCHKKVPIALVLTGLEREVDMEDWWRRYESDIVRYGLKSRGHACITAVHDGTPEELGKYNQSQDRIRDVIKTCSLESAALLPERYSWFAKFAKGMVSFIKKRSDPGRKKILKVLTQRCHLAQDVAEKIVDMMEKSDLEPKEEETEQPGIEKDESGCSLAIGATSENEYSTAMQSCTTLNHQGTQPQPPTGEEENDTGHLLASSGSLSSLPRPHTTNVILFGEIGSGKSTVLNLIARKNVARVSSDVNGCTMESTSYQISFDDTNFTIFDTISLEEPEMGPNDYLRSIEKAFNLITTLEAAGGVHLLLFCMHAGRITATTQSNYRMFYECLFHKKVPIALVVTGLEGEADMEDWWRRNEVSLTVPYDIKSRGHACITAAHDGTPEGSNKYNQSQERIRDLIKTCCLESPAPLPEPHSWFAKFAKEMTSFIRKRSVPGRQRFLNVLTQRCHLALDVAGKIFDMMGKSDPEVDEDETVNEEGQGRCSPTVAVTPKDNYGTPRKTLQVDTTLNPQGSP